MFVCLSRIGPVFNSLTVEVTFTTREKIQIDGPAPSLSAWHVRVANPLFPHALFSSLRGRLESFRADLQENLIGEIITITA